LRGRPRRIIGIDYDDSGLLDPLGLGGLGAEEDFWCRTREEVARGFFSEWNASHPNSPLDEDDFQDAFAKCHATTLKVRQKCPPGKPEGGTVLSTSCLKAFWNSRANCKYGLTPKGKTMIPGETVACKRGTGGTAAAGAVGEGDLLSGFSSLPTWIWYALAGLVVVVMVKR